MQKAFGSHDTNLIQITVEKTQRGKGKQLTFAVFLVAPALL